MNTAPRQQQKQQQGLVGLQRLQEQHPNLNAILAPSDYYQNTQTGSDVVMGTPMYQTDYSSAVSPTVSAVSSNVTPQDGIKIIGAGCYYNSNYIATAQLCMDVLNPVKSDNRTPSPGVKRKTMKKNKFYRYTTPAPVTPAKEKSGGNTEALSVWATLKTLPILGQLLKDV